ncbi:MAG: signal peptidase I [Clostridiales bacterium]|nr:signal peptidase I [Clostridiales bacterium]
MKKEEKEHIDKEQSSLSFIIELIIYFVLIIIITNFITSHVVQRTIVEGWSMENTLYDGDNIIVEKVSHRLGRLERFDIIAFYPNGKDTKDYYIKRIIGLPGEHVRITDNKIYIDSVPLEEDYGKTDILGYEGIAEEGIVLSEDEYFVLGDNRTDSYDSRYEEVGPVKFDKIEGKAVLRIWPLNDFGTLD